MLNCSHPDCILHHHHYYHGRVQHHLQDDRAHHEHPTHHSMPGESGGAQDSFIEGYLTNDTNSELSSLSHLDAPNDSVYMICGVLIAMLMVGLIIVLLAVTIRARPIGQRTVKCCNCRKFFTFRKLRKREESSGVVRTTTVHPEGVLQAAPVADPKSPQPSSLESIFISTIPEGGSLPISPSDSSLSSCTSTESTLDSTYSVPMFLYSTSSRNTLNSSNQSIPVHPCVPPDECEKRRKGPFKGLRRKKSSPTPDYSIPIEYKDELKKIYVY